MAATGTIFVSIASYRDSECAWTLRDLFAKAADPGRVWAGVLWQIVPEEDGEEFIRIPAEWAGQVRGRVIHVAESRGACWARHRIQEEFFRDEDYYLQIDSHTRFDPGWDEQLIGMRAACPSARAVLSTHPNRYEPPDERFVRGYPHLRARKFNRDGVLVPQGEYVALDARPEAPRPSAFIGGGLLFGPGSMVREVPYDPYLYFHGEEISMSVRLWTHGYDLYTPNSIILYHNYSDQVRRKHWDDHKVDWGQLQKNSVARLEHLLAIRPSSDPAVLQDIERHGLGTLRTLSEYQVYADVDLRRRHIGMRASDGRFPPHPPVGGVSVEIQRVFAAVHRENRWGSRETRCGSGSMVGATIGLRDLLRDAWGRLGVRTLVDAGCGDLNWLGLMSGELDLYLGFDVVPELIAQNRVLFWHRKNHFFNVAEICHDALPGADAVLCRNTLPLLPNALGVLALRGFRRSGARYLLATTFPGAANVVSELGQWHPVDLTAPPFSLPEPLWMMQDGKSEYGRFLGVWRLAE
ncbi:MAG: hypothetical protein HQM03_17735 [Magnetococcales bacterium]|nr:hypothetical protein [Magnetococcales bacterium]